MTLSELQRALAHLGADNLKIASTRPTAGRRVWSVVCEWRGEFVHAHDTLLDTAVVNLLGDLSIRVEKLWERIDAEKKGQSK